MIEELNEISSTINKIHHLTDDVEVKRILMVAESQLATIRVEVRKEKRITFHPISEYDYSVNLMGTHVGSIYTHPVKCSTPVFKSVGNLTANRLIDIVNFLNELEKENE